jgi:hypothetical protein
VARFTAAKTELVVHTALAFLRLEFAIRAEDIGDHIRLSGQLVRERCCGGGFWLFLVLALGLLCGVVGFGGVALLVIRAIFRAGFGGLLGSGGAFITTNLGLTLPVSLVQGGNECLKVGELGRFTDAGDLIFKAIGKPFVEVAGKCRLIPTRSASMAIEFESVAGSLRESGDVHGALEDKGLQLVGVGTVEGIGGARFDRARRFGRSGNSDEQGFGKPQGFQSRV